jgi:endoglucanase
VNIPDWAIASTGTEPSADVLFMLRRLGFTYVRLPLDSDDWIGETADLPAARRAVAGALDALAQAGLAAMIDFHPSESLRGWAEAAPLPASRAIFSAWQRLSSQLAAYAPAAVFPELLNEPPFARGHWLDLRDELISLVRTTCPEHTIVWGADRYQSIGETIGVQPPDDANTIAAVHYYTPMSFTHQCADWDQSGLARIRNLPFPASAETPEVRLLANSLRDLGDDPALALLEEDIGQPWTIERIGSDMQALAGWAEANKIPVLLNEFGVLDSCVDGKSRNTWIRAVRASAEAAGLGWAYWELDHGFGFMNDRESAQDIDMSLLAALLGGEN